MTLNIFDDAAETRLAQHGEIRHLERGERLVAAGEAADTLYFVRSGRFHVVVGGAVIAEISEGDPIGEIAFFSGARRTADVVAARDSEVLALDRTAWEGAAQMPGVVDGVLKSLSERLGAAVPHVPRLAAAPPKVVVLVPAGGKAVEADFAKPFAKALSGAAPLRARDIPADLRDDPRGIARWLLAREGEADTRVIWIEGLEETAFAVAALRQSDLCMLVGDVRSASALNGLERLALTLYRPEARHLVLLREPEAPISGTAAWIEPRAPHLHHHVATQADISRAGRLVSGRGLGLILAGGGALCCAHLGIARALDEAGVQIDMYGGTSGGAAMAIALAAGLDPMEVLRRSQDIFVRSGALKKLTIPIHALLDHHPFDSRLQEHYGMYLLEDLPVPVLAVSTSLTRNGIYLHRTGDAWKAVRASGSLPGLLPPVVTDSGEVLIDGGIVDNLPIAPMQELKLGPNIVVGLSQLQEWRLQSRYESLPGRLDLARDLVLRRRDPQDFPRIMQLLQKSMAVTSRRAHAAACMQGNVLVVPPIPPELGLMDWHAGERLAEIGYAHMRAQIDAGLLEEIVT
ncbi:hypothetical protein BOO69_09015 [Sulfitobacter alexandrii]|uniref:Cyclic nucleotide-binding domain-containing protein n=1 Tax=Sulfitobacter alexandrii TaxID=1917485 RepID=A0A1J0WH74_9RHOB|nr:cyclic nucleotide-binding and patatin-like phospholipase domain-containing protein [Sulfitobacter alexandrii]APE43536.1 hypothetical protein BOO69_09015 [Sulfitobacter alexandrii]